MKGLAVIVSMAGVLLSVDRADWSPCAPLPLARAGYAGGVLGGKLVVAGGSSWAGQTKTRVKQVDAYLPGCNCWQPEAAMPDAVSDAASTVADGQLFVVGGSSTAGASDRVYSFDGASWRERPEMTLPEPRTNGMAVTAGRRILLIGGLQRPADTLSGLRTSWIWNLDRPQDGWKPLPLCPCLPRASAAAVVVNGRLQLAGGLRADQAGVENLSDLWELDLASMQWRAQGHLPEGRRAMWGAAALDGMVLFGGYTDDFRRDILFVHGGRATSAGELPFSVADAKVFELDGRWYVAGGEIGVRQRGSEMWSAKIALPGDRH